MRAVKGFDRPIVQWVFVALAIVLVALAASLALALRRLNGNIGELRGTQLTERTERDRLDAQLARERATREALALELARLRASGASAGGRAGPPTLTLQPLRAPEATPPPPTMNAPDATQVIELRLMLPDAARTKPGRMYEVTIRDWVTGQMRLARAGLKTSRIEGTTAVTAFVTGDVFATGSYEVILRSDQSELATYEITVR